MTDSIANAIHWRHSTKAFDADKKISAADFATLKEVMRFSPSSTNIQPWHFIIADNNESKQRIAKATDKGYEYNTPKVLDASHVVVYCSRIHADTAHLEQVLDKEEADGRFKTPEARQKMDDTRQQYLALHRYDFKDESHWLIEQVYLNMGALLLTAASLKIDAVPMEGADLPTLDAEFGLRQKGLTAVAVVALGYHSEADFNADLPKSRLDKTVIFSQA